MTIVLEALGRGRELVGPTLRAAVERLDPHTRLIASYHLGWCDRYGTPIDANHGKALRPCLALLATETVSGGSEAGVPGAVAVELVHNFSLIHDDLMDRDAVRRHRGTVWSIWGDAMAVLVGDALLSLAHETLAESGSPYAEQAGLALGRATRQLIRGQVQDVAFETRDDVGLDECVDMAAGKTGALLGASAEIGALFGGAGRQVAASFREYGSQLGLAFQLVDDVLGIWGAPEVTGKPVHSDLAARKKTMPVVWSLENGGAEGRQLARWLREPGEPEPAALRSAAELIERCGAREWAVAEARDRVRRAESALDRIGLDWPRRQKFSELGEFVVERNL